MLAVANNFPDQLNQYRQQNEKNLEKNVNGITNGTEDRDQNNNRIEAATDYGTEDDNAYQMHGKYQQSFKRALRPRRHFSHPPLHGAANWDNLKQSEDCWNSIPEEPKTAEETTRHGPTPNQMLVTGAAQPQQQMNDHSPTFPVNQEQEQSNFSAWHGVDQRQLYLGRQLQPLPVPHAVKSQSLPDYRRSNMYAPHSNYYNYYHLPRPHTASPMHFHQQSFVNSSPPYSFPADVLVNSFDDKLHLSQEAPIPQQSIPNSRKAARKQFIDQNLGVHTEVSNNHKLTSVAADDSGSDDDPMETHPNKFPVAIEEHMHRECCYKRQPIRSGPQIKVVKKSGEVYSPLSPSGSAEIGQEQTRKYYRKDLVRVCVCGRYDTKEALLENRGRDNDADGYEVHYNIKCRWKSYEDFKTKQRVLIRLCKCYKPSF